MRSQKRTTYETHPGSLEAVHICFVNILLDELLVNYPDHLDICGEDTVGSVVIIRNDVVLPTHP